jgi:hypothetical protein
MQTYLTVGEHKIHDLQVRYEELPNILCKYEAAQGELEQSDDFDHSIDRETFEEQYYQVKARFYELLHPNPPSLPGSPQNWSEHGGSITSSTHSSNTNIQLPTIALPSYSGDHFQWLNFRDTFESLIIHNTALSNVQRFHYLLAALKGEAKQLITNLSVTNDNFAIAWKLVTDRYNNIKLIAMKHVSELLQMPQRKVMLHHLGN